MLDHQRPLLIAHRAGNRLAALGPAADAGAHLVEIDVWHHRGRVEVGHGEALGPIPLRWDRWQLSLGRRRDLVVRQILRALPEEVTPMFDLKGTHPDLPRDLQRVIAEHLPGRAYAVSSQNWDYLHQFLGAEHANVVRSVASAKALQRMRTDLEAWAGAGVGLHRKLLSPQVIEQLREHTEIVLTWTVNDVERATELVRQGVTGIITDSLEVIRAMRAE